MRSVTSTVNQTSYRLICGALRGILRQAARVDPTAGKEIDSILYRASAVLYELLLDHPIDRRGRCRSCRRPGARITLRRRTCLIHLRASYGLLRQPDMTTLLAHLGDDPGPGTASLPGAGTPPDPPTPACCPQ
jgi:hypothetical protein